MDYKGGEGTALETIALLETRLQRLEFYTTGSSGPGESIEGGSPQEKQENVQARLQRIEAGLQQLAAQSQVVRDILNLRKMFIRSISASEAYILQTAATLSYFPPRLQKTTSRLSPVRNSWP